MAKGPNIDAVKAKSLERLETKIDGWIGDDSTKLSRSVPAEDYPQLVQQDLDTLALK